MSRHKATEILSTTTGAPAHQHNAIPAGGRLFAVQHGDQYVYNYASEAPYRVSVFEQAARPMTDAIVLKMPSRMLAARNHLVPFYPRAETTRWLLSWRDAASPGLSARLVYGTGGQGKTRLAHQFCSDSEGAGWTVIVARHSSDPAAAGQAEAQVPVVGRGLLVLIDYADRWKTTDLLACLRQHAYAAQTPIRALLLARSAGGWSDIITRHLAEDDGIEDIDQLKLPALASTAADRTEIYLAARDRFAAPDLLNLSEMAQPQLPDLTEPGYERVLDLHMRALVDVHAAAHDSSAPIKHSMLTIYLLHREQESWRNQFRDITAGKTVPPETMGRTVFLATLLGPLAYADARWLLGNGQLASTTETVDDILSAHCRLYPPPDPTTQLSPLYPDRVGEDFLALSVPGVAQDVFSPDPWTVGRAAELLQRLSEDQMPAVYTRQLLIALIETARRWPHILALVTDLFNRSPALVLVAGGTAINRLAEIPDVEAGLLNVMEQELPTRTNINWDIAAAALMQRVVDHPTNENVALPEQSRRLVRLGVRLSNAGDNAGAYRATATAVQAYRELAAANPAAYTADLASALNNLGNRLSALGRREEALTAATEAVQAYRELAAANPAAYTPHLASALNNLGNILSDLGRREEALTAATEAVQAYRELAAANPAAYTADLAMSLNNLGNILSDLGRREEALTAATEAVQAYRELAAANPAAYTADLAMSLNNLGNILSARGRREEALTAATEAVQAYRELAAANPAAYTADLASALNNLGNRLSARGRREEALTAATEAVELRRTLAAANPAAYTADLASALNNLGNRLSARGRREEALTAATEAVELRRTLAAANPAAYTADLAMSLNNLGNRLSDLGRREEALTAATEAVELRRTRAAANPAAYTADLAMSLNNLGNRLSALGRREEALTAATEAVQAYRELAAANAAAYTADLASALNNLGNRLSARGRREEALTAATEAVELRRTLAAANPAAYTADLASALNNLGNRLSALGRREEALTAATEAVQAYRELAAANPAAYTPHLASALNNLGNRLSARGRREEALTAATEAVELRRTLAAANPAAYTADLASALNNLGNRLSARGRREEALTAATEAVELRRTLANQLPPGRYESQLS